MTKDELLAALREIVCRQEHVDGAATYYVAQGHQEADDLLLQYIGDEDIENAYDDIDKWYS